MGKIAKTNRTINDLTDEHYQFIEEKFEISKERFLELVEEDDDEMDELFDEILCNADLNQYAEDILEALEDYFGSSDELEEVV